MTKKASTALTVAGRRAKLTLAQGRRGEITLAGKASFTPEEFQQWLGRATWYVNDLMGAGPSNGSVESMPSLTTSDL